MVLLYFLEHHFKVNSKPSAKMMRVLLAPVVLLFGCLLNYSHAGVISFDGELIRAEVVFVGRIIAHDKESVTVCPISVLRGTQNGNLVLSGGPPCFSDGLEADYLFVSQGDNYHGKPQPGTVRDEKGQGSWCGWIPYPVVKVGERMFVKDAIAFYDGQFIEDKLSNGDRRGLFMEHVRFLLEHIPYDADCWVKRMRKS